MNHFKALRLLLSVPAAFLVVLVLSASGAVGTSGGGGSTPTPVPTATNTPTPTSTPCPTNFSGHCYAIAELSTGTNEGIDGVLARYDVESYEVPDWQTGGHSNQTLWLSNGLTQQWCEVGWTDGYIVNGVPQNGYTAYSAYTEPGSSAGEIQFFPYYLPSYGLGTNGTVHAFQIYRTVSSESGTPFIDFQQLGGCDLSTFWLPNLMEAGLEYTDESAVNQGVSPYGLQVRQYSDFNSAAPWQNWDQAPATATCSTVGSGAYVAWLSFEQQFTDSSNVVRGTSC